MDVNYAPPRDPRLACLTIHVESVNILMLRSVSRKAFAANRVLARLGFTCSMGGEDGAHILHSPRSHLTNSEAGSRHKHCQPRY